MFKRIRINAGDTLQITMQKPDNYRRVVRAQITKGSGTPVAKLNVDIASANDVITVNASADTTMKMSGTYKYEIAVDANGIVKTIQYGILEVM